MAGSIGLRARKPCTIPNRDSAGINYDYGYCHCYQLHEKDDDAEMERSTPL